MQKHKRIGPRQETAGSTSLSNTVSNHYPQSDESNLFTPNFKSKRDDDSYLDQTMFHLDNIKIIGESEDDAKAQPKHQQIACANAQVSNQLDNVTLKNVQLSKSNKGRRRNKNLSLPGMIHQGINNPKLANNLQNIT